jgi:CheY-like chemotaxis protein
MTDATKAAILIVDDSPEDIRLLMHELRDFYAITACTSADEALQLMADTKPDIVLMDINMPGTDGYSACRIIKESPELADIDVIFLSSNDSTEEVLQGFDAGAVDYLVKPYAPLILLSKIKTCLQQREARQRLAEAAKYASAIAMTAMTDTGDLGTIMNFLRTSFSISTIEELGQEICNTLKLFALNACVYLHVQTRDTCASTEGQPTELEINLIKRLAQSSEPIVAMGSRLVLTKPNAVLLIKNMPQDADKAARIRDHLMILLEGVVAKVTSINSQIMVDSLLNSNINQVIKNAESALKEIQQLQEVHKKRSIEIMENMVHQVEASFFSLGLTDTQEEELLQMMSSSVTAALNHFEAGMEMDEKVRAIIHSLSHVANRA